MQSAWQSVGKPNGIQNRNETLQEWEMKKIKEHKLNIRENLYKLFLDFGIMLLLRGRMKIGLAWSIPSLLIILMSFRFAHLGGLHVSFRILQTGSSDSNRPGVRKSEKGKLWTF